MLLAWDPIKTHGNTNTYKKMTLLQATGESGASTPAPRDSAEPLNPWACPKMPASPPARQDLPATGGGSNTALWEIHTDDQSAKDQPAGLQGCSTGGPGRCRELEDKLSSRAYQGILLLSCGKVMPSPCQFLCKASYRKFLALGMVASTGLAAC